MALPQSKCARLELVAHGHRCNGPDVTKTRIVLQLRKVIQLPHSRLGGREVGGNITSRSTRSRTSPPSFSMMLLRNDELIVNGDGLGSEHRDSSDDETLAGFLFLRSFFVLRFSSTVSTQVPFAPRVPQGGTFRATLIYGLRLLGALE